MTPSLRTARACRAAAVLLLAAAGYAATHRLWLALPGLYAAAVFAWCAAREGARYRREVVLAQRAERLARPRAPWPPGAGPQPCCAFWRHSYGAGHGPECTRSAAARPPLPDDCCERWWTSLGARHDADCRRHAGAWGQDRARPAPQ
ncbi:MULTISPECIES: hypothetical protein [Streptomyces]|uniref:Integral membrane protein n=1 Tax=Streptomyces lienomycini TaxID=284035 RepID=A0ABV9X6H2_9ACTN|nr:MULTISPECIES: hypothetical protein [Streptomyces]